MAGSKNINKAQKRENAVVINTYEVIADMDGNPNSPAEFDESPHNDDEVFFKAEEGASQVDKNKVLILNYIHQDLHHATERKVPVLDATNNRSDLEIYHRANFQGVDLDVCVFWQDRGEKGDKFCSAVVKFASDDMSDEHGENGTVYTDAAWTAEAQADKFTKKNEKLVKNYWAPRWKYVVNALRNTAYNQYERNGVEKPYEPEAPLEADDESGDAESQEEKEEQMPVYYGATGKIIGPKGAKIQEIRKNSGVKDIRMPAKNEDGTRPKARELVNITIIGKPRAIKKAREMIQDVVDEWANAPRPGRQDQATEFLTGGDAAGDYNTGGVDTSWENGNGTGGEGNSWENSGATGGGDNSWETGGAVGGGTRCGDWASASVSAKSW